MATWRERQNALAHPPQPVVEEPLEARRRGRPSLGVGQKRTVSALLVEQHLRALELLQARWGCSPSEVFRRALLIAANQDK